MIKIDSLFQDRYKVERYIGQGGMADVYKAVDIISKQDVAIKIIREDIEDKNSMYLRFVYEIRISALIQNHYNIIRLFDFGKTDDGLPYMITEYINGRTLKDVLNLRRNFAFDEACYIICQLLDAMEELSLRNVIHRDIKPQNIYLEHESVVKLADFGISLFENDVQKKSSSKNLVGTPQYIAPEIILGESASIVSDIYSVGITFFEMICGCVPYDDENIHNVLDMAINKDFPDISVYRSSAPESLKKIIYKACEKDPKKRYRTIKEFKDDILKLLENKKNLRTQNWFERFFGLKGK